MKATIDIPDELYRQVKAKSALEGRAVRDVTSELFHLYVEGRLPASAGGTRTGSSPLRGEELPAWVGVARHLIASDALHDWTEIRAGIDRGWAEEVAEPGPSPRTPSAARASVTKRSRRR